MAKKHALTPVPAAPKPEPASEHRFLLEDAFDYFVESPDGKDTYKTQFHNRRAVLAVAYLLDYCTKLGDGEVTKDMAMGFSDVLRQSAAEVGDVESYLARLAAGTDEVTNRLKEMEHTWELGLRTAKRGRGRA